MSGVAYHEAGHAVVNFRFCLDLGAVTIILDHKKNQGGSCTSECEWGDGSIDSEAAIVFLAGYEAQRKYDPAADFGYSADDEAEALRLSHGRIEELRSTAAQMVENNWRQIEAVAMALIEDGTLKGEECEVIVNSIDEGKDWRVVLEWYRKSIRHLE